MLHCIICLAEYPESWGSRANSGPLAAAEMITLDSKSSEYKEVLLGFEATVSGKTIVKIERVQNYQLYAQYATKKRLMDQATPPGTINERRLYHGCGPESVKTICQSGFNRSYSGKNGKCDAMVEID